jgi:hypothetical protein
VKRPSEGPLVFTTECDDSTSCVQYYLNRLEVVQDNVLPRLRRVYQGRLV